MPHQVDVHTQGDTVWTMTNEGVVIQWHVRGDGTLVRKFPDESPIQS
jgi:hypothetical protein